MFRQIVSLFFVACLVISSYADEPAGDDHGVVVVQHNAETFAAALQDKTQFTMFYAPWCGHCKRLTPTWDELAKEYNTEDSPVTIAKVDCTIEQALCSDHGVRGYPTIKFFQKGQKEGTKFALDRSLGTLKTFIEEQISIKPEEKKEEEEIEDKKPEEAKKEEEKKVEPKLEEKEEEAVVENVVVLSDEIFEASIETGHVFVKFYAPWCGHCKRLAPIWDDLAAKFKGVEGVSIAKVDCTTNKGSCGKLGIRGYPTLKFFSGGQHVSDYSGGRALNDLEAFVKKTVTELEAKQVVEEGKVPEAGKEEEPPKEEEKPAEAKKEEEKKVEPKLEEKEEEAVVENVVVLSDEIFEASIETGHVFVKFYAPWCGHCKRLAPIWDDLAAKFKGVEGVSIAKIDCTTNRGSCSKLGVKGYPTLKFFSGGKHVEDYGGARGLTDLTDYVKRTVLALEAKVVEEEEPWVMEIGGDDLNLEEYNLVYSYLPTCESCQEFLPIWEATAKKTEHIENWIFSRINCEKFADICKANELIEPMTIRLFRNGQGVEDYTGEKTADDILAYVENKLKEPTPTHDPGEL